jgi:mannitol/fructose-specific phosphotransferase system IIA component (Ntr-type)
MQACEICEPWHTSSLFSMEQEHELGETLQHKACNRRRLVSNNKEDVLTLAQFTSPALIVPELRSHDASGVVAELCAALQRAGRVHETAAFFNAVMSREQLGGTAPIPGWALPHARLEGLPELCFAVRRVAEPLLWFGPSGNRVSIVVLAAVPEKEAAAYLNLVSGLARLSQERTRAARLLQAPDSESILELLGQVHLRQPRLANAPTRRRFDAPTR